MHSSSRMSCLVMSEKATITTMPSFLGRIWGESNPSKMNVFSKYVEIVTMEDEVLFRQTFQSIREWCVPSSGDIVQLTYSSDDGDQLTVQFQTLHAFEIEYLIIKYTHQMAGLEPPPQRKENEEILIQGYLMKRGGFVKNIKQRWFILYKTKSLFYYRRPQTEPTTFQLKGSIPLDGSKLGLLEFKERPGFFIQAPGKNGRKFILQAPDDESHQQWVSILSQLIPEVS
eukprot:TRINITY_DN2912_c0_g1_i2.p1 TRINITY_DN2912_c0_g1~~TRINITY_DN2912_c0_g1_i2.p1  ORF type:complete len:228 (+),score=46.50 TRINITY_DN2912_c0_g1_i2:104-787(+)